MTRNRRGGMLTGMRRVLLSGGSTAVVSTPAQSTTAALWWRGGVGEFQESTFTTPASADADPVGGWQDQTSNVRHLTQATAARRLTYKPTAGPNSLPTNRLDAVDDRIGFTAWNAGTAHTFFIVAKLNNIVTGPVLIGGSTSNYVFAFDGTSLYYRNTDGFVAATHGYSNGQNAIFAIRRNGTTVRLYKNGAQIGTDQTLAGNTALTVDTLGGFNNGTGLANADIAEVYGDSAALADAVVTNLFAYFNGIYQVY